MDYKSLLFSFEGRTNRQPFWMVWIAIIVVNIILTVLMGILGQVGLILMIVFAIAAIWIGLAVQVKRWHDRDKSGWWVLINLVPVIGAIWVIVECGCLRGTAGQNRFGPDPLAGA